MFNKKVSPDGDHVVLTQFILSVTWCHLDDESHIASFPLLYLKHHVSNPSPASSAMQCLLWRPLPSRAFSCSGVTGHTSPLSLQALAFLQPVIALTHSNQPKPPASRQSQIPFLVRSFPRSHGPYPRPFLPPAALPWVGVIRSTPLLCGD